MDLRPLLDPRVHATALAVDGVRCGELAQPLLARMWTSADGDELPGERRRYEAGRVFRRVGDVWVEITCCATA